MKDVVPAPLSFIDFLYLGMRWVWWSGDSSPAWCPYVPLEALGDFRGPQRGASAVPPRLYPCRSKDRVCPDHFPSSFYSIQVKEILNTKKSC